MNTRTNQISKFNDLRILVSKLESKSSRIRKSILNYEKFFYLIKKNPGIKLVPTKDIDKIWHIHRANTDLYKKDSVFITGYVVGHKEAKTKVELHANKRNYSFTSQLWQSTFNLKYGNNQDMALCGVDGDGGDDGGSGK